MITLFGLLLPLGIGAAISPIPTTICIMLLSARKPLRNATAFLIGYSTVLVAIGIFALTIVGGGGSEHTKQSSAIKDTIDAMLGVLLLVLTLRMWLRAPDPSAPPSKWINAIGSTGIGRALLFGMIMMATNFSSLPLYISGLKEIVTANIGIAGSILVLVLFILLVEVELLVPIVGYALAPRRAGAALSATRQWLEKNNRVISIFIFVIFGVLLLVKGVMGLWR